METLEQPVAAHEIGNGQQEEYGDGAIDSVVLVVEVVERVIFEVMDNDISEDAEQYDEGESCDDEGVFSQPGASQYEYGTEPK